ncbi:MAG: hypothetical protein WD576_00165 [Nitriliruptoraceae bacterium]
MSQKACSEAVTCFARTESIIPAPQPTHAVATTVHDPRDCRESGEEAIILTAVCGRGHFDMTSYNAYLTGELSELDTGQLAEAMRRVLVVAG